jgi:hypothetical protein
MPTPAAGSELMTALTKTSQITVRRASSRPGSELFNRGGAAARLPVAKLFAVGPSEPGPALRRGALIAVPVAASLVIELGLGAPTHGAIGSGAALCGCAGMDAPARNRALWQLGTAPAIGLAAGLGILSSQVAVLAVLAMGLLALAAGYCFAVSLRLAICGLMAVLGLLIAQGLMLPMDDLGKALLFGTAGALTQPLWSLIVWAVHDRESEPPGSGLDGGWSQAGAALRANLKLRSHVARHAIRFGAALALAVAIYRALGLEDHGYWVPLTVLFVMRPERGESYERILLRAAGTAAGLVIATALAEAIDSDLVDGILLSVAIAIAFGTLTVQYAVFSAAITIYVVLLVDTLGEPAWEAAGQRTLGTVVGLAIVFLAFLAWPNRDPDIAAAADPPGTAAAPAR